MGSYSKGWTDREEIDWDKVDTSAPVPLTPGIYFATVSETEPKLTKGDKPKPSIRVVLEVTERYGGDEEEARPRKQFDNFTMTQEGAFKAKNFSEATGIELPSSSGFEDVEEFAQEMVGQEVWVQIGTRRYEGRDRNQVQYYLEDDEEVLETANAQFDSGNESRRPKSAGSRKRGKKKPEPEPEEDDEEEEEEKQQRRSAKAKKKASKKKTAKKTSKRKKEEDSEDLDEDDEEEESEEEEEQEEQTPRRARRRRRAQAEQE